MINDKQEYLQINKYEKLIQHGIQKLDDRIMLCTYMVLPL